MGVKTCRIMRDLNELAQFGKKENGISRFAFTEVEREALKFVQKLMKDSNMETYLDQAGNLIGRYEYTRKDLPSIIMGSHIDTVPNGGKYDGSVGVIGGIEVIRAIQEEGFKPTFPLEVVVFSEEEAARFPLGLFGSYAFTNGISTEEILKIKDKDNISLKQALKEVGFNPTKISEAKRDPSTVKNYIELHVEQGRVLEDKDLAVGIVTGIAGQVSMKGCIEGKTDHAGATPMMLRKDALTGAAEVILATEKIARRTGSTTVATVGSFNINPNASNIIPGKVIMSFDIRDVDNNKREVIRDNILSAFEEICNKRDLKGKTWVEEDYLPKKPSTRLVELLCESCREVNVPAYKIPSGALHDAVNMADITDMGMIFIRSKDGISHSPDEYSSPEDITLGVEVMKKTIIKLSK